MMAITLAQFRRRYAPRWHGTRQERHEALDTVFREMKCGTLGRRKRAWRDLAQVTDRYERQKRMIEGFDRPAIRGWLEDVTRTATQLADLLEGFPNALPSDFVLKRMLGDMRRDPESFIADIRVIASAAADRRTIPGAHWKGRAPESAFNGLIRDLALVYEIYTRTRAARSVVGNDDDPRYGEPVGPFYRFVDAVLVLIGDPRTRYQIEGSIRRHAGSPFKDMDKSIR